MVKQKTLVLLIAAVAIIAVVGLLMMNNNEESTTIINKGVTNFGEFDGTDTETGTSLQATYYIQKDGGQTSLLISAVFDIDQSDWAGIELAFPETVTVTEIMYNYQDGFEKGLSRMISTEQQEYTTSIEVGNVFHGSPSGGGQGSIIIKGMISESASNILKIRLGLGSSGTIMYTTIKDILIKI